MPPSIFRTPDFSNQFPFPLEVRKIGIPLYFETKTCPFWLTVYITNDKIYALMYALFIVLKWLYIGKQSTVFSTETSQLKPRIHFCLWQGIILRCISTFMWNWNSTFCTPGVHRTLTMYSPTRARQSVWPEFDLFDDVPSSIIPPGHNQLSTMYHTSMYNIYKAFTQEETQFVDLIGVED